MHSELTAQGSLLQRFGRKARFVLGEFRPKGELLTPFNILSLPLIVLGLFLIVYRFVYGLGSITNLSQSYPWGLWIGFDVVTGVAFAGGAYVVTFMVYILKLEKYRPITRATILNGFLAYLFYAGALLLDLGRPWNVINPIIGNSFGVSSVLFLVAWHFLLYMIAELIEFSPAIAEWLGLERLRRLLRKLTLGAVIFGITLSTLHQSGLGALFLMAKTKIHPLWYSEFIPVLFLVSSVFAGLSMVIFEGSISQRVFAPRHLPASPAADHAEIVFGLAKICCATMFVYLFLLGLVLVHGNHWALLGTGWGAWYLVEVLGFVLLPCVLFAHSLKVRSALLARVAALITMLGIIINRLNVSVIAFKWYEPVRYFPTWMEIEVSLAIVLLEIWVFRWVVKRMRVL
ncbi:MAG: polysulfide reductase NrfD [Deltaproteobacteria bacterium]|nr:polysulfide reductase NrfD [Deltaproteobacteria bacterium]